jgi:uncharacterized protein (AIM24 family)
MAVPVLLTTSVRDETRGGITYHIEGELVPVLHVELQVLPIYFEHHILLWKDPDVGVEIKALQGAFKRVISGMPVFMTQARGPGRIAFSRDGAGHIVPIHLKPQESIDVREHQFLAATDNVDFTFKRVQGIANMLFGSTGFFVDTFICRNHEGTLWLHGYGNVFEVQLRVGESIDIEPGGWIYKDPTVTMDSTLQKLTTSLFGGGGGNICWNRFTGPGKVGLQSMYLHTPEGKTG